MKVNKFILEALLKLSESYLSPKEHTILKMRAEGKTLSEIGKKFNLSRTRIAQIEVNVLGKLNYKGERIINTLFIRLKEESRFKSDEKLYIDQIFEERIINPLLSERIRTVFDLIHFTKYKLLEIEGIGRNSLREIENRLDFLGYELEPDSKMEDGTGNRPIKYNIEEKRWEFA